YQLVLVAGALRQAMRHDDLGLAIDRRLRVVALDVSVLGLQDAALVIGEVALRLAVGLGRRRRWRLAVLLATFGNPLGLGRRAAPLLFLRRGLRPPPSSSAAAFASASSSALAARIFSSRFCLLATHSGISSPRLSP